MSKGDSVVLNGKTHCAAAVIDLDGHEFYSVIPNMCEGSYTISALFQISPFGLDVKINLIILV